MSRSYANAICRDSVSHVESHFGRVRSDSVVAAQSSHTLAELWVMMQSHLSADMVITQYSAPDSAGRQHKVIEAVVSLEQTQAERAASHAQAKLGADFTSVSRDSAVSDSISSARVASREHTEEHFERQSHTSASLGSSKTVFLAVFLAVFLVLGIFLLRISAKARGK